MFEILAASYLWIFAYGFYMAVTKKELNEINVAITFLPFFLCSFIAALVL